MKTNFVFRTLSLVMIIAMLLPGGVAPVAADNNPVPIFEVHPQYDLVYILGIDRGVNLNLFITDSEGVFLNEINATVGDAPWDPNTPAADFSQSGFDFQPGQILTVSGEGVSKTYYIPDPKVVEIDVITDTITGTGTPGSRILVCANQPGDCVQRWTDIDATGNWLVSYAPPAYPDSEMVYFDLIADSNGWAVEFDADGNKTWADDWRVPSPYILAYPSGGWIYGFNWPSGVEITLAIDLLSTLETPDYTLSTISAPSPWNPNESVAMFTPQDGFNLLPGDRVTMAGAGFSKELTITDLGVMTLDTVTDTLSGTALPGGQVRACAENAPGECRYAATGSDGIWNMPPDPSAFILRPGVWGWVLDIDIDGDNLRLNWNVPNPRMDVRANSDQVESREWGLGEDLSLQINGEQIATGTVEPASYNPAETYITFNLSGMFDIKPGDIVSLSNGAITKITEVTGLEITAFDLDQDLVLGKAAAGSPVDLWACVSDGCHNRHVITDGDGNWSADFAQPGPQPDEQDLVDITGNVWVDTQQFDNDRDSTMFGLTVPNLFISANPGDDWVIGYGWPFDTEVTLTIGSFSASVITTPAPWDPNISSANFGFAGQFDLLPGAIVTVSDGSFTKTMTVANFSITELNVEENTLSGIGSPGDEIYACAWETCRHTAVDEGGHWIMLPDPDGFVLQRGIGGYATDVEPDQDETFTSWNVPNPRIEVRANYDQVDGREWGIGDLLSLQINGEPIATGTVEPASWNPADSYITFNLSGVYDIVPGDIVSLSNGAITKTTEVTGIEITAFDWRLDRVLGKAAAGSPVDLWACMPDACYNRHVITDSAGNWMADFAHPGPQPDELDIVDIAGGVWVDTQQFDDDRDSTLFGHAVPNPTILASPSERWVYSVGWALGEELAISIDLLSTGEGTDYSASAIVEPAAWDPNTHAAYFPLLDGMILLPGDLITIAGTYSVKSITVTNFTVTKLDTIHNSVSGTGAPGYPVYFCPEDPPGDCYNTTVGEDGTWTLPAEALGFALQPGVNGRATEDDQDYDSMYLHWQVPTPTNGKAAGLGWFNSPAGALSANPAFSGKAAFTFAAAYDKRSASFKGTVLLTFKNFVFASTSLDWLVMEGDRMQLTGSGKVNAKGNYGFMLNAQKNATGKDTITFRIWKMHTGEIVYDSALGAADYVPPSVQIKDGGIVLTK